MTTTNTTPRRNTAPTGAQFDSPGRFSPGYRTKIFAGALKGRNSRAPKAFRILESRPDGAFGLIDACFPGLNRPGLSNPAPLGLNAATSSRGRRRTRSMTRINIMTRRLHVAWRPDMAADNRRNRHPHSVWNDAGTPPGCGRFYVSHPGVVASRQPPANGCDPSGVISRRPFSVSPPLRVSLSRFPTLTTSRRAP